MKIKRPNEGGHDNRGGIVGYFVRRMAAQWRIGPAGIGLAVSFSCIRLFNQDIIDLYTRVPAGRVTVIG